MISVFGSFVDDEEIKNVTSCMKSQWMGFGKQVEEFEKNIRQNIICLTLPWLTVVLMLFIWQQNY